MRDSKLSGGRRRSLAIYTLFGGLVAASALFPIGAAQAQDGANSTDELVVTAQRREERLSDVPITVQAISPAALETAGITSALDLPALAPGLTTSPGTNAGAFFTPFIRGVGANSTSIGNDPSVALFIDGVYQTDKAANVFTFNDVERIEVLKGPQGTLFGRNATGGAINVISRKPSFDPEFSAEVSYGRFEASEERFYLTGPIVDDRLAASLSFRQQDGNDYVDVLGGGETGGDNTTSASLRVLWTPTDNFEVVAAGMYSKLRSNILNGNLNLTSPPTGVGAFFGGVTAPNVYTVTPQQTFINRRAAESFRGSLHMRYSLPSVDLVSITGYTDSRPFQVLDYDASSLPVFYFYNPNETHDVTQEFQVVSTHEGPFQYVAGVYYINNRAKLEPLTFGVGIPYPATDANALNTPGGSRIKTYVSGPIDAWAVYAQGTYSFSEQTNLTVGLRYSSETRRLRFRQYGLGQLAPGFFLPAETLIGQDDQEADFAEPTYRLSIDHHFTPEIMAYASYNRGFKSGTYNLNDFCAGQTPVDPEILDAYEVGLKTNGDTVRFSTAAFYYDFKDIQVTRISPSACGATSLQNAGGEEMYGLDAELVWSPTANLSFNAAVNLLSSEYTDFTGASGFAITPGGVGGTSVVLDATGQDGIFAPEFTFTLGADYRVALANDSSLAFNGTYYYTSDYKTVVGEGNFVDAYGQLGAAVTWAAPDDKYYVRLWGRNLTDEDVIGRNLSAFGATLLFVPPMSYGVALGVNFN